jgi:hypothetical protein
VARKKSNFASRNTEYGTGFWSIFLISV